jgi:PASTA domain
MTKCPDCDWENEPTAAWCANPDCGHLLQWENVQEVSTPGEQATPRRSPLEERAPIAPPPPPDRGSAAPIREVATTPKQVTRAKRIEPTVASPAPVYVLKEQRAPVVVEHVATPVPEGTKGNSSRSNDGHGLYVALVVDDLTVMPGREISAELVVRNTGSFVEHVDVRVDGLPGEWTTLEPREVNLDVKKEGKVTVRIRVPRATSATPGLRTFEVVAWSSSSPTVNCSVPARLQVEEYSDIQASLEPMHVQARKIPSLRLTLTNKGNRDWAATISASDANGRLSLHANPRQVSLGPGKHTTAVITASKAPLLLTGNPVVHQIQCSADDVALGTTPSIVTQMPKVTRWMVRLAAVVLVVVAVGTALAIKAEKRSMPAVPAVTNEQVSAASQQLTQLGLVPILKPVHSPKVEVGLIVGQSPPPGQHVRIGTHVNLEVGDG